MTDKYPMFGDDWRCRWMVIESWRRLHRVARISWDDDDKISGYGETACGYYRHLEMPGFLSRIMIPRCGSCCRMTGTPRGDGCPENGK